MRPCPLWPPWAARYTGSGTASEEHWTTSDVGGSPWRGILRVVRVAATVVAMAVLGMITALAAFADPVAGPVITVGSSLGAPAVDAAAHRVYVIDEKTSTLF